MKNITILTAVFMMMLMAAFISADPITVQLAFPSQMTAGNSYTTILHLKNDANPNSISWNFTIAKDNISLGEFSVSSLFNYTGQEFTANCTQSQPGSWNCLNGTDLFAVQPNSESWITLTLAISLAATPEDFTHQFTIFADNPLEIVSQQIVPTVNGGSGGGGSKYQANITKPINPTVTQNNNLPPIVGSAGTAENPPVSPIAENFQTTPENGADAGTGQNLGSAITGLITGAQPSTLAIVFLIIAIVFGACWAIIRHTRSHKSYTPLAAWPPE